MPVSQVSPRSCDLGGSWSLSSGSSPHPPQTGKMAAGASATHLHIHTDPHSKPPTRFPHSYAPVHTRTQSHPLIHAAHPHPDTLPRTRSHPSHIPNSPQVTHIHTCSHILSLSSPPNLSSLTHTHTTHVRKAFLCTAALPTLASCSSPCHYSLFLEDNCAAPGPSATFLPSGKQHQKELEEGEVTRPQSLALAGKAAGRAQPQCRRQSPILRRVRPAGGGPQWMCKGPETEACNLLSAKRRPLPQLKRA